MESQGKITKQYAASDDTLSSGKCAVISVIKVTI